MVKLQNIDFENEHRLLLERHLSLRTGERRGRLLRGHQYAEKLLLQNVWWPLFGNLEHLHPEYEVYDWNRKSLFLDVAFLPPFGRFGLECRPEICRMLLQTGIEPSLLRKSSVHSISPLEREVIRLAWNLGKGIRPKDVMNHYGVNFRTARKWLQGLADKGMLRPITF